MITKFMQDPQANSQAVVVLAALIFSLVVSLALTLNERPAPAARSWYTALLPVFALLGLLPAWDLLQTGGLTFILALVASAALLLQIVVPLMMLAGKPRSAWVQNWFSWSLPVLVAGGLAVAGYMAFVEATEAQPACGPVGDCGSVQSSPYALLLGILPVGVLGLAGYLGILVAWLVRQFGPPGLQKWGALAAWGQCLFGVMFSAYLTFLEPFVIGASCMWCLTSAVLMINLLWVTTPGAKTALDGG